MQEVSDKVNCRNSVDLDVFSEQISREKWKTNEIISFFGGSSLSLLQFAYESTPALHPRAWTNAATILCSRGVITPRNSDACLWNCHWSIAAMLMSCSEGTYKTLGM